MPTAELSSEPRHNPSGRRGFRMPGGDAVRSQWILIAAVLAVIASGLCAGYIAHWPG